MRFRAVVLLGVVFVVSASGRAHETDQYSVPTGREFADLRFWISEYMYDVVDRGVERLNERIRRSLRDGQPTATTSALQSSKTVVSAVNAEFPSFVIHTDDLELELASPQMRSRYPGLLTIYLPPFWIYHHPALLVDITKFARWLRASTLMVDGTYFGTDKILHFVHVGYLYFLAYQDALNQGRPEEEAVRRAVEVGAGPHPLAETRMLGTIATGVISNGDLAADYAALKFYRNLTESVKIKGEMRPPLLIRDGPYYRFNSHVRRDSDFFKVFISDHWNEALNPSAYASGTGISIWIREELFKRCPDILEWYCDEQGRPYTKEHFQRIAEELSTYYGEDYGHQGHLDEMVTVANVCFESTVESDALSPSPVGASPCEDRYGKLAVTGPGRASSNTRDALGRTALWRAAKGGREGEVEALSLHSQDVDAADIDAEMPLHAAARGGHASIVRLLLDNGANPNPRNKHGLTPLHIAAQKGESEVLEVLLKGGADAQSSDNFGCTPLHDIAARGAGTDAARLLQAGAYVNAADRFGTTPLHRAARAGNLEVVESLVAAGADWARSNTYGRSPADEAAQGRNEAVMNLVSRSAGSRLGQIPVSASAGSRVIGAGSQP